jgi:hypothetical protein
MVNPWAIISNNYSLEAAALFHRELYASRRPFASIVE